MDNDFTQKLDKLREQINKRIEFYACEKNLNSMAEPVRYILLNKGKRLRPILTLLSAEVFGFNTKKTIDVALAFEILHNFTLVHDDIMDNDDFRRGKETVHKKWNVSVAILTGDALLGLAYKALTFAPSKKLSFLVELMNQTNLDLCDGQNLDKDFEKRKDVTTADYVKMISLKTAKLLSVCAKTGAFISDASEREVQILENFGNELGLGFQIQDDLFDIVTEQNILGKDIGSDLAEGKKTFAYLHAVETLPKEKLSRFFTLTGKGTISKTELEEAKKILYENGTIKICEKEMNFHFSNAEKCLLELKDKNTKNLHNFLNLVVTRKF